MYGTKDIASVGKVELAWVNTPLPPVAAVKKADPEDGDTGMEGASAEGDTSNGGKAAAVAPEVDYDVAEEDDRWMIE